MQEKGVCEVPSNGAEVKVPRGTASVKAEYVIVDHVHQPNLEFITKDDKSKIKCSASESSADEPPKKKLRGQNKNRPRDARVPKGEKLCFKIGSEGSCPYGSSCVYSHDVGSYLAKKPTDIGSNCYLFDTYGKCPYGFSCRFGACHLKDSQNICNEELWNKMKETRTTQNVLSRDLQNALRKRRYDFQKSEKVLKVIESGQWKETFKNKMTASEVPSTSSADKLTVSEVSDSEIKIPPSSESVPTVGPKAAPGLNCVEIKMESSLKNTTEKPLGPCSEEGFIRLKPCEVKKVNFRDKLYLAPLTTVGNLPFRRICKEFGADITCGEMAVALNLLQGELSEWALLKRHHTEDVFGVQICGAHPDIMTRCAQMLNDTASIDFIDVNMGCPLDFVCRKGSGCGLMSRQKKMEDIVYGMSSVSSVPITLKMRTGIYENTKLAHTVIKKINYLQDNIGLLTIHGRSREQRYTKSADWDYIKLCSELAHPVPLYGNGDVLSYEDYNLHQKEANIHGIMIARGALIKPWIFTEIKEQRHWDISSSERFDFIKKFANYGLDHWGSDSEGVGKTRRFLLEWLSFLYRYIPVGLLERVPQHINERPPRYFGRNDLETLMASHSCADWVKISEMLLGPVPESFTFLPKHKANAYG